MKFPLVCFAAAVAFNSFAEDVPSFVVGLTTEYSDNIRRTNTDQKSGTTLGLSGALDYSANEDWYRYSLDYSATHEKYSASDYDSRSDTTGAGHLTVGTTASWLQWNFDNTETTTLGNITAADVPSNRSQRSTFSTGPLLRFQLSRRDLLNISSEFTKVSVQNANNGSERLNHQVSLKHRVSNVMSMSLTGSYSTIEPDFDASAEYNQSSYNVGLSRQIKDGSISLSYGIAKISNNSYFSSFTGDTKEYSVAIDKQFWIGSFSLNSSQSMSDSGLGTPQAIADILDIGNQSFDIETRRTHSLSYTSLPFWGATRASVTYGQSEAFRLTLDETDKSETLGVSISKPLTTHLSISAGYSTNDSTREGGLTINADRKTKRYSLSVSNKFSQSLSGRCGIEEERITAVNSFSALQLSCSVSYKVL